jgi:hypothetical protein
MKWINYFAKFIKNIYSFASFHKVYLIDSKIDQYACSSEIIDIFFVYYISI